MFCSRSDSQGQGDRYGQVRVRVTVKLRAKYLLFKVQVQGRILNKIRAGVHFRVKFRVEIRAMVKVKVKIEVK